MPLSSGLGSSAASAVAAVFAVNLLAGSPLSLRELLPFTMEAERVARAVVAALYARRPRSRYRVGNDPLRAFLRFLPTRVADGAIRRFL